MKYPFEKQSDLKDCGVCCLLMITRYYGGGVSREYLRNITNTTKDGVSAYNLLDGAKKLGFDGFGVNCKLEDLSDNYLPCIAHVIVKKSYQHFVVIYNINKKSKMLLVADPSKNKLTKLSFEEFNKISTGKFILIKPAKKITYVERNSFLSDLILKFLINNYKKIFVILFMSIIFTLFNIFCSFQLKILMEYVINYQNINNLIFIALVFLYLIIIKETSNFYRNYLINCINHKLDKYLISNVYHHILSLPYLYYKNRTTGEVLARINDLSSVRNLISKLLITALLDVVLALLSIITLFLLNIKLTVILLITIFFIFSIILIFRPLLERKIISSKKNSGDLNSYLVETIGGIETIKNQNIQPFIEKNFLLKYSKYNKTSLSYNYLYIASQFLKSIIEECGTLFILIIGSYLVVKSNFDVLNLIVFITLMNYVLEPIKNLMELDLLYKDAKMSLLRISELYEVEEERVQDRNASMVLSGKISTNHLMFSYNGKDLLLKDVSVNINPGDKVLIYGSSGSGKSTFAKILSKQLSINNKLLYYDSKDINCIDLMNIRKEICYISQQETLFTDSIYRNIVLDKEIDYDTFLDTASLCMIDEFAENSIMAYDLLLEENGFNLSGGQRQRIILARSLLKNASIYIMDESLNELDVEKERKILEKLFNIYKNKTFIIISHRFHNQDLFNKKYCIEDGVSYEK